MRNILQVIVWICICVTLKAQDYQSPVDFPIRLSGSFGELRKTHFHAGIDIKSPDRKVGHPIRSIEDGYISRIKISPWGYGNVLYINHPSGHTSVYAHLHRFNDLLDSVSHAIQYAQESFSIDTSFSVDAFPVKKGEVIGLLGNSGYSFGPHLHFEIRDQSTENPLHPQSYGFLDVDNKPPHIRKIIIYSLAPDLSIISRESIPINASGVISLDTLYTSGWRSAIGVSYYDPADLTANKNGIYSLETLIDSQIIYQAVYDEITWDAKQDYTQFIDYGHRQSGGGTVDKGFRFEGEQYTIDKSKQNGVFPIFKHRGQPFTLRLTDFHKNTTEIAGIIFREEKKVSNNSSSYQYKYRPHDTLKISQNGLHVAIKKKSSYTPFTFSIDPFDYQNNINGWQIGQDSVALRRPLHLSYSADTLTEKHCWFYVEDNSLTPLQSRYQDGALRAEISRLGGYIIAKDTVGPSLVWNKKPKSKQQGELCSWVIQEDSQIKEDQFTYSLYIDGEWALLRYDPRTLEFTHQLEKDYSDRELELVIRVTDLVGNSTVLKTQM